jgi:hypothetical protein
VRGAWRNFVPRPDDDRFFAERMTARLCVPDFHAHPLATHFKSAHRAVSDVRVGRGNHEAFSEAKALLPLRGWYPIEVLHFPVRSLDHCTRKYVTQFVALERNAEKGIPDHMAEAYRAYRSGRLDDFYAPLVVDDEELGRGLGDGTYAIDTRLRDVLRSLGFGAGPGQAVVTEAGVAITAAALFAAESSVLPESDVGLALGERVHGVETRVGRLERSLVARVRSVVGGGRGS